jgi:hypothetical protein
MNHACLNCQHAADFRPEFPTDSGNVAFAFICQSGCVMNGAYGFEIGPHTMWWWPTTDEANVDGGQRIPHEGCASQSPKL